MPKIETAEFTAPAAWASYLINGDSSGLDFYTPGETEKADAWAESLPGPIVDCRDAGFIHWHDARAFLPLAADCQFYTVHVTETKGTDHDDSND